jgi:formate--tetrahydrofolate ligase
MAFKSDIEIAQEAVLNPIADIAGKLEIPEDYLESYGKYKAKVDYNLLEQWKDRPNGKLILVTAINPTPAGEGKTTTSVGLGDALAYLGHKTVSPCANHPWAPSLALRGGLPEAVTPRWCPWKI